MKLFGHRKSADDYTAQRERMVRTQIAARGVTDAKVLEALREIPRHCFIPDELRGKAYGDHPVSIGRGQTISQPYMVGLMTELLTLEPGDRVLEIGTGSGYQTAVLAELAAEVVSVERIARLADDARACLEELGYGNVTVNVGDGTMGWPDGAPYDAILVTAAGPEVPGSLKSQLSVGGRLVCPAGPRDIQTLYKLVRTQTGYRQQKSIPCVFVPLLGEEGWGERESG